MVKSNGKKKELHKYDLAGEVRLDRLRSKYAIVANPEEYKNLHPDKYDKYYMEYLDKHLNRYLKKGKVERLSTILESKLAREAEVYAMKRMKSHD